MESPTTPADSPRPQSSKPIWFRFVIGGACVLAAPLVLVGLLSLLVSLQRRPGCHFCSREKAMSDVIVLQHAILAYGVDHGCAFPTKLDGLLERDGSGRAYFDAPKIPKDSWGREYVYMRPGPGNRSPRVVSYGRDGRPGGIGEDEDIGTTSVDRAR